jgi:hypothetical protein
VASGTLTAGSATVRWVVWAEDTGSGKHRIFISRLVNGDHFELFNGGQPLSPADRDATHPDITFFGNVPYVSWIEAHGDRNRGFVGHFENNVFVLDTPGEIMLAPRFHRASLIDARVPVSSSCTADPFTNDGQACAPAAVNSAFDLFTINDHPQRLFGQAVIGGPNCVLFPHCRLGIVGHGDGELIEGNFAHSNSVGILVQRIVATKRVHGKRVLVLRTIGRVPLGHHHKGQLKIRWNLKVNGHRLARGRYLITLRAFDGNRTCSARPTRRF